MENTNGNGYIRVGKSCMIDILTIRQESGLSKVKRSGAATSDTYSANYSRKWYQENKEEHKRKRRLQYQLNRNLEKERAKSYKKTRAHQYAQYVKKFLEIHPIPKYQLAARNIKRLADKNHRTPKWLTREHKNEINYWYKLARDLAWLNQDCSIFHVDHIVPLRGKYVSGLHVPWNLQLLHFSENLKKGNKFIEN